MIRIDEHIFEMGGEKPDPVPVPNITAYWGTLKICNLCPHHIPFLPLLNKKLPQTGMYKDVPPRKCDFCWSPGSKNNRKDKQQNHQKHGFFTKPFIKSSMWKMPKGHISGAHPSLLSFFSFRDLLQSLGYFSPFFTTIWGIVFSVFSKHRKSIRKSTRSRWQPGFAFPESSWWMEATNLTGPEINPPRRRLKTPAFDDFWSLEVLKQESWCLGKAYTKKYGLMFSSTTFFLNVNKWDGFSVFQFVNKWDVFVQPLESQCPFCRAKRMASSAFACQETCQQDRSGVKNSFFEAQVSPPPQDFANLIKGVIDHHCLPTRPAIKARISYI